MATIVNAALGLPSLLVRCRGHRTQRVLEAPPPRVAEVLRRARQARHCGSMTHSLWIVSGVAAVGAVGAAAALAAERDDVAEVLALLALTSVLTIAAWVDIRERRVPNALTYPAILGALGIAAVAGGGPFAAAAVGLVLAAVFMGIARVLSRGQLGMGDVKLAALAGAAVGAPRVAPFLLVGTGAGALVALVLLVSGRPKSESFPYAPPLAAGALITAIINGTAVG